MSATETRIYRVIQTTDDKAYLEMRALSTSEKNFVVSNLQKTEEFDALIDGSDTDDVFSRFGFKIGQDLTEDELVEYAELRDDLKVIKVKNSNDEVVEVFVPAPVAP